MSVCAFLFLFSVPKIHIFAWVLFGENGTMVRNRWNWTLEYYLCERRDKKLFRRWKKTKERKMEHMGGDECECMLYYAYNTYIKMLYIWTDRETNEKKMANDERVKFDWKQNDGIKESSQKATRQDLTRNPKAKGMGMEQQSNRRKKWEEKYGPIGKCVCYTCTHVCQFIELQIQLHYATFTPSCRYPSDHVC